VRRANGSNLSSVVIENLRLIRKQKGHTQLEFAGLIGVPPSVVSNYEVRAVYNVSVDMLSNVGTALDVVPWTLTSSLCPRCSGMPPEGFSCNDCGAGEYLAREEQ
jgi:transcriptional regulator with XRE-family HTH domain